MKEHSKEAGMTAGQEQLVTGCLCACVVLICTNAVRTCNGTLLSHVKEQHCVICRDVDRPRLDLGLDLTSYSCKSEREKQYHILMHLCGI